MHHITIGADPEFACFRANELVQAGPFLDKRKSRSSRMNTEGGGTTIFESSLFGEDGSSKPFEVRPNPSKEPLDVVENIHSILRDAVEFEPELMALEWSAGSCPHGVPIGGHIHFGTLTSSRRVLYSEAGGLCLDNYLGCILTLIEGPEGTARRSKSGITWSIPRPDSMPLTATTCPTSWPNSRRSGRISPICLSMRSTSRTLTCSPFW